MLFIPCFESTDQMDFYGFVYGACHHMMNLDSATQVLYSQCHDLVSSKAVCIVSTTNKIVKYHAVIGLLAEATTHDIDDLVVFMDSQLVVSHLNHVYAIQNPVLL